MNFFKIAILSVIAILALSTVSFAYETFRVQDVPKVVNLGDVFTANGDFHGGFGFEDACVKSWTLNQKTLKGAYKNYIENDWWNCKDKIWNDEITINTAAVEYSDGTTAPLSYGFHDLDFIIWHRDWNLLWLAGMTSEEASAGFRVNSPAQPDAGLDRFTMQLSEIELTASAYDIDGFIETYTWDFGDGTSDTIQPHPANYEVDLDWNVSNPPTYLPTSPLDNLALKIYHVYTVPGTYVVTLTVTDNDGATQSDSKTVIVAPLPLPPVQGDTTAPEVTVTYPAPNAVVNNVITVKADASDSSGIDKIKFYVDGSLLGIDNEAPYEVDWDTSNHAEDAWHSIYAKAEDKSDNANTGISDIISVFVNNVADQNGGQPPADDTTLPQVTMTAPVNGVTVSGTVYITAEATDASGVATVEFFVSGVSIGTDTTGTPYTLDWDTTQEAEDKWYSVYAKALDTKGNLGFSDIISVYVDNENGGPPTDDEAPAVSITYPAGGTTIDGTVIITVSAADNEAVSYVDIYIDGTKVATDPTSPYTYSWDTLIYANTGHDLSAKAYDPSSNEGTSALITVYVDNNGNGGNDAPTPVNLLIPTNVATNSVTLIWSQNQDADFDMYEIHYSTAPGFTPNSNTLYATTTQQAITSAVVDGLASDTTYYFKIRVYDDSGLYANSNEVSATTDSTSGGDTQAPSVAISYPSDGAELAGTISITASASDNVGVAYVEFYIDGTRRDDDASSPYVYSWDTTSEQDDTYTIQAKAFDASSNSALSQIILVTVDNENGVPPTGNDAPIALAGEDKVTYVGQSLEFEGHGDDDGYIALYEWDFNQDNDQYTLNIGEAAEIDGYSAFLLSINRRLVTDSITTTMDTSNILVMDCGHEIELIEIDNASDPRTATFNIEYEETTEQRTINEGSGIEEFDDTISLTLDNVLDTGTSVSVSAECEIETTPYNATFQITWGDGPVISDELGNATSQRFNNNKMTLYVDKVEHSTVKVRIHAYDWQATSSGRANYSYDSTGNYNAVFRVTDNDGATDTDFIIVIVESASASANAGSDVTVFEGDDVQLAGTVGDEDVDIILYQWDFEDDGVYDWSSSSTGTATHVYDDPDTYTARFAVTTSRGALSTDSVQITVLSEKERQGAVLYEFRDMELEVSRDYTFDASANRTIFTLYIKNLAEEERDLLINETISKDVAEDIDNMTISPYPDFVFDRDPLFGWHIDLDENEEFEVTYKIDGRIPLDDVKSLDEPIIVDLNAPELDDEEEDDEPAEQEDTGIGGLVTGAFAGNFWSVLIVFVIVILVVVNLLAWKGEGSVREGWKRFWEYRKEE